MVDQSYNYPSGAMMSAVCCVENGLNEDRRVRLFVFVVRISVGNVDSGITVGNYGL